MARTFHDKNKIFSDEYFVTTDILGNIELFITRTSRDEVTFSSPELLTKT